MRTIIFSLLIVFSFSCKKENTDNTPTNNNNTVNSIDIGDSFIGFTIDSIIYETGGELNVTLNSLPTVLVARAPNRLNQKEFIGIGVRSIDLDTTKFPYTFYGNFGFTLPNADVFIQTKEGDDFILYTMESDGSETDIIINEFIKDSTIIKGSFSGKFQKIKSDKDYLTRKFITETSLSKGNFKIKF